MTSKREFAQQWLSTALAFGLLSGFLESGSRVLRADASPDLVKLGAYVAWMPAASAGAIFLAFAIAALPLAGWQRSRLTTPRIAGLFGALAAFNVLWVVSPPFALYAVAIMAVGIGVTLTRWAASSTDRFARVVGRVWPPLLAATAVVAIGIEVGRGIHERRALRTPPPAGAPNVLVLLLDTVRAMNLSAYGFFRPTSPVLSELAAQGVRFEEAYSTSPWSLPSHASMFTGRWPHEIRADWETPFDDEHPTLAEAMTRAGFATGGFVANLNYTQRQSGIARGFAHYDDLLTSPRQVLQSSRIGQWLVNTWHERVRQLPGPFNPMYHRKSAEVLHRRLLGWIDGLGGRPFLAFVNYFDAHTRYYAPGTFPDPPRIPIPEQGPVPSLWGAPFTPKATSARYDKAISYVDFEIGRLFDELRRRGTLDNTIVIVTSDHGEEFREHGIFGHGNTLYLPALRIPMLVRFPASAPAGRVVKTPVSLRDVAATVVDLAGIADRATFPGRSLASHWRDSTTPADTILAEVNKGINLPSSYPVSKGDMRSMFVAGKHLILGGDGVVELYDVTVDPWQQRNLANDSAHQAFVASGTRYLRELPGPKR